MRRGLGLPSSGGDLFSGRNAGEAAASADTGQGEGRTPLTVSEITREIKTLIEGGLSRVWVEGEVSNLSCPASGHIYFTLKDERASLACVMWRSASSAVARGRLADGARVVCKGRLAVYEPRGQYQLVCDSVQAAGKGELQERFELLVQKLKAEGLFDQSHKQPLPNHPRTVGIATSPAGAALRDMLRILRRRLPGVRIILAPCAVQGEAAKHEIAAAVGNLDASGLCDVIIVGRGGGSVEDLWAFNEELVARAVYECSIPIISAVGHETDITICDLVADFRAATPSEAAETAVPEAEELRSEISGMALRLRRALLSWVKQGRLRLSALASRPVLRDPREIVQRKAQRMDELSARLRLAGSRLPEQWLARLRLCAARLEALSPVAVLARGYSITRLSGQQTLVRSAGQVKIGDAIETRLAQGSVRSTVTEVEL